ncbi:MAG TPA: TIGR00303 family protein [Chloroflexota bacterium]|nr:TIGR00303 family protein [Chloroflexota bacterium]
MAERWRAQRPAFCCVLAHTDTCLIPGLSAAGVSEELRPLTPAADAEVVLLGSPRCLPTLPSNPLGAPGPAAITRAALQLGGLPGQFVGTGLTVWPETPCLRIDGAPGGNVEFGNAVPHAQQLFEAGYQLGVDLTRDAPYVVIGESVPGGTTTALAVLLALGYNAEGRVSGSQPGNAHVLKTRVAHAALAAAGLSVGDGQIDPIGAVAQIGDPMQPLAAGAALGVVGAGKMVLLAGGSQMLAVAALVKAMAGTDGLAGVAIGTTRWIVSDPAADVAGLAREIEPTMPILAANLDFSNSRHQGLHAYEAFMVKEGVGAGGACIAALLATGLSIERLEQAIDDAYDDVLRGVGIGE